MKVLAVQGRLLCGAPAAMMVIAPFIMPEAPDPAIARPTMNMLEFVARPQIKEPSSKIARKARKTCYQGGQL